MWECGKRLALIFQKCVQRPEEISSSSESSSTCTEIDEIIVPRSMKGHAFNTISSIELGDGVTILLNRFIPFIAVPRKENTSFR
jgi:hypothetical protein